MGIVAKIDKTDHKSRMVNSETTNPGPDTRTAAEFLQELSSIRTAPLRKQLLFMQNARNRDRAMSIPRHTLTRLFSG